MSLVTCLHTHTRRDNVYQEWDDYQLKWTGEDFGDISVLRIKPSRVWTPDIVLFNKYDHFQFTAVTLE